MEEEKRVFVDPSDDKPYLNQSTTPFSTLTVPCKCCCKVLFYVLRKVCQLDLSTVDQQENSSKRDAGRNSLSDLCGVPLKCVFHHSFLHQTLRDVDGSDHRDDASSQSDGG